MEGSMRKLSIVAAGIAIVASVMGAPGAAQAANGSGNTYLFTDTGGYWQIWKTYQEVSPGVYNGSWGTHSYAVGAGVAIMFQEKVNGGKPVEVSRFGNWTKKKTVYFRVCDITALEKVANCSGWW
jgi:hypothetical protein